MKVWAWVWVAALGLLGWAPALALSYFIALALALGSGLPGPTILTATYLIILAAGVFLLVQVRRYLALSAKESRWYTWAGGVGLVGVWTGAFVSFALLNGIYR